MTKFNQKNMFPMQDMQLLKKEKADNAKSAAGFVSTGIMNRVYSPEDIISGTGIPLEKLAESRRTVKTRIDNTVQAIRAQDLALDKILNIDNYTSRFCSEDQRRYAATAYAAFFTVLHEAHDNSITDAQLADAVELLVAKAAPASFLDDNITNYTRIIKNNIGDFALLCLAVLMRDAVIYQLNSREEKLKRASIIISEAKKRRGKRSEVKDREAILHLQNETTRIKDLLEAERDKAQKERARREKELGGEIRRLTHEIAVMKKERCVAEKGESAPAVCEYTDEEDSDVGKREESALLPLPTEKVVVLGGHNILLTKLQAAHPDWVLINEERFKRISVPSDVSAVFIFTSHMSHKLYQWALSQIGDPDRVPIMYVSATNIPLLENEMQKKYTDTILPLNNEAASQEF